MIKGTETRKALYGHIVRIVAEACQTRFLPSVSNNNIETKVSWLKKALVFAKL